MIPVEIKLADRRRSLTISWEDGVVSRLDAALLRRHSQAASAVRARVDGREPDAASLSVTDVEPIGTYAVRLSFSDGHDRGIYPWSYLRSLADKAA